MSTVVPVIRLQFARRGAVLVTPLGILLFIAVLTALIQVVVSQVTGGTVTISGYSASMAWGLLGYLVYLGVQSVATTYPLGLSFGATRRGYALGTLASHALLGAYFTAVAVLGWLAEQATGGWWSQLVLFGQFDVDGTGLGTVALSTFAGSVTALTVGAVFGASWVRFGTNGPVLLTGVVAVIAVGVVYLLVANAEAVTAGLPATWMLGACAIAIAAACAGVVAFLRRASVR